MRNLKRALSLALAAAMLISLMVVGASAADYGDQAEVTQTEAVDVLTAIGVVGGDQNGNFNPTATLTRAEFCVMIANALTGGSFDQALFDGTNTPFTDVAGHWGAGYIAYCYSNGIVAGTSATTFEPDGTLTAAQAAAILLMALGYNQNNEFAANGQFSLNVTRWAQQSGLYDGLTVAANAGISRQDTAKLIFNALTNTTPVGYSSLTQSYYTVGTSAVNGVVYYGNQLDPDINNTTVAGHPNYYDQTLGYTNFTLVQDSTVATDDFGRPANTWKHGSAATVIGSYATSPVATYSDKATRGALFNQLGRSTVNTLTPQNSAISATDTNKLVVYVDGAVQTISNKDYLFTSGSSASISLNGTTDLTGNGSVTEVYRDRDGNVTIAVINTYLVQATAAYNSARGTLTVQPISEGLALANNTLNADDFTLAGYEEDDYILVTASLANGRYTIQSVQPAATVTAEVTGYTEGRNVTMGGTTYNYAFKANTDSKNTTYSIGDDAVVVLDANSNVIYVDDATVDSGNYVYINQVATANGLNNDWVAAAYFTDGSYQAIPVRSVNNATTNLDNTTAKGWYTYSINSNDQYVLTSASTAKSTVTASGSNVNAITSGQVTFGNGGELRANAATLFLVQDADDTVTVYTGIANAPTLTVRPSGSVNIYYMNRDSGYARFVFVDAGETTNAIIDDANAADSGLVYILRRGGTAIDADRNRYTTFNAIVDGETTTINVADSYASSVTVGTLYNKMRVNDDGYVTSLSPITADSNTFGPVTVNSTTNAVTYDNGVLSINGTPNHDFVVGSGAEIYLVLTPDSGLMSDAGANYEVMSNITAENLFRTLRGYTLTGTTYYAEVDSDTGNLVYLYMRVGGAATENMGVTFNATTNNAGVNLGTLTVTQSNGTISAIQFAGVTGSLAATDTVSITATVAEGASSTGTITVTYNSGSWVANGTITVVGVDGTVNTYTANNITVSFS